MPNYENFETWKIEFTRLRNEIGFTSITLSEENLKKIHTFLTGHKAFGANGASFNIPVLVLQDLAKAENIKIGDKQLLLYMIPKLCMRHAEDQAAANRRIAIFSLLAAGALLLVALVFLPVIIASIICIVVAAYKFYQSRSVVSAAKKMYESVAMPVVTPKDSNVSEAQLTQVVTTSYSHSSAVSEQPQLPPNLEGIYPSPVEPSKEEIFYTIINNKFYRKGVHGVQEIVGYEINPVTPELISCLVIQFGIDQKVLDKNTGDLCVDYDFEKFRKKVRDNNALKGLIGGDTDEVIGRAISKALNVLGEHVQSNTTEITLPVTSNVVSSSLTN